MTRAPTQPPPVVSTVLNEQVVTLALYPKRPMDSDPQGYIQSLEIRSRVNGGYKKVTKVKVLGEAVMTIPEEDRDREIPLLAARLAYIYARDYPPPLAASLRLESLQVQGIIDYASSNEEVREAVEQFFYEAYRNTRATEEADWFLADGVALATGLNMRAVVQTMFDLRRAGILEIHSDVLYRMRGDVYQRRTVGDTPSTPPSSPIPAPEFSHLTSDTALIVILEDRWQEAERLTQSKAPRFALIAYGSLLEGVLYAKVHSNLKTANTQDATPKDSEGKAKPLREWSLNDLIQVAKQAGWIHPSRMRFGQVLREYRNYVHPREEHAQEEKIDEGVVDMARTVVLTTINDLLS
ncbi:hypothetical protein [Deinococcus humi]|uniref:DUF4145 domain-containing protein n=1 Tax=Deinococcus humi TaxID=662880 RepID=A0A7W8JUX6_9DEIO|nr:hypothetical protein [Deinococcus humi]MBB5362094.1 hypothetical protein [Deinococcus humi]